MTKRQLEVLMAERVSVLDRHLADLPLSPTSCSETPVFQTQVTTKNKRSGTATEYLRYAELLVDRAARTAVSNIHYHSAFDISKAASLSIPAGMPSGLPAFLFPTRRTTIGSNQAC